MLQKRGCKGKREMLQVLRDEQGDYIWELYRVGGIS